LSLKRNITWQKLQKVIDEFSGQLFKAAIRSMSNQRRSPPRNGQRRFMVAVNLSVNKKHNKARIKPFVSANKNVVVMGLLLWAWCRRQVYARATGFVDTFGSFK
jgi:hypothetical protein